MTIVETRTALVLGATGGVGGGTARALPRHGWRVRVLVRDPARAAAAGDGFAWVRGDAIDPALVQAAA